MSKTKGLYSKYSVSRTDGRPIVEGCIVLEWKDQNARKAIELYADLVRSSGNIDLAEDLKAILKSYERTST